MLVMLSRICGIGLNLDAGASVHKMQEGKNELQVIRMHAIDCERERFSHYGQERRDASLKHNIPDKTEGALSGHAFLHCGF